MPEDCMRCDTCKDTDRLQSGRNVLSDGKPDITLLLSAFCAHTERTKKEWQVSQIGAKQTQDQRGPSSTTEVDNNNNNNNTSLVVRSGQSRSHSHDHQKFKQGVNQLHALLLTELLSLQTFRLFSAVVRIDAST